MSKIRRIGTCFAAVLAAGLSVGCASHDINDVSYKSVRRHLTPELQTSIERPIDVDRNLAVTDNLNLRMMMDDLGRAYYSDRPTRLTPFPIMKSSGQPH